MKRIEKPKMNSPIDLDILASWMDRQNLGSGAIYDQVSLSGGTQNIMFRFKRSDREFIFRHPPKHPRPESNRVMQREGTVLSALAGSDVPHPGFIAGCWDEKPLGAYFFLMEPIVGFNIHQGLSDNMKANTKTRERMGYSYVEAIAKLGNVDYINAGLEDFGKPDNFLERQGARWLSQIERYAEIKEWDGHKELGDFGAIATWLNDNIPSTYRPGVLHGDCHIANVLFNDDSGEVAALIDWEMSTIGDPLLDLGWLIATYPSEENSAIFNIGDWSGFATTDELVAHYGRHSSRSLEAIDWYAVLACFKLGTILESTYSRAQAGKAPMAVGERLHKSTIQLFDKARDLMRANS
jgi:aminoglycoside phosphotransferase (APT) family kinase protein